MIGDLEATTEEVSVEISTDARLFLCRMAVNVDLIKLNIKRYKPVWIKELMEGEGGVYPRAMLKL